MPADYTSFVSTIKEKGLAKQYFYCELMPPLLLSPDTDVLNSIPFYMAAVNMPELSFMTIPVKDNGLTREVIVDKSYGTITMTMFSDQNMTIKNFFDTWATAIISDNGGVFEYPDNYVSTIIVSQLNSNKDASYIVNLDRAYPKSVSDVYMSSDAGGPLAFSVTWAYESWIRTSVTSPLEPLTEQKALNKALQVILKAQNAVKTVATMARPSLQSILTKF